MPQVFMVSRLSSIVIWQHYLRSHGHMFQAHRMSGVMVEGLRTQSGTNFLTAMLLSTGEDSTFPVKEAINAGHQANFQAFLWHGWDINQPLEREITRRP